MPRLSTPQFLSPRSTSPTKKGIEQTIRQLASKTTFSKIFFALFNVPHAIVLPNPAHPKSSRPRFLYARIPARIPRSSIILSSPITTVKYLPLRHYQHT